MNRLYEHSPQGSIGLFQIKCRLQGHPELSRRAEIPRQPERGIRRDGALAENDFINTARRHSERPGEGVLAQADRREELLGENFARMNVG